VEECQLHGATHIEIEWITAGLAGLEAGFSRGRGHPSPPLPHPRQMATGYLYTLDPTAQRY